MNSAATWWYLDQLKRKRLFLESDQQRVKNLLARAQDKPTIARLKRELETIDIQLRKNERGLLY